MVLRYSAFQKLWFHSWICANMSAQYQTSCNNSAPCAYMYLQGHGL